MNNFFNHKAVRDLAWTIYSPPLMTGNQFLSQDWCERQFEQHADWLKRLDKDPRELEQFITARKNRFLGKYFEALLEFWFLYSPQFELLGNNIQVTSESYTVGEYDFLVRDKPAKQVYHIEVAVKFYLGKGDQYEWNHWIGPNARDRLDKKLNKLLQHQLNLKDHPAAEEILNTKGISDPTPVVLMKGMFFYHPKNLKTAPCQANPFHTKGWWVHQSELRKFLDPGLHWKIVPGLEWIPGYSDPAGSMNLENLLQVLEYNQQPCMVAGFDPLREVEKSRGFIVPEKWPGNLI